MATGWDAFISYSHAESERTAIALQRGLERFARPWYQRRAIRVFRDNSAMSTNPALWPAIEQGLIASKQLIVLLSPTAAASPYVERETAWWVTNKGTDSILLVQDAGPLSWTVEGRFSDESAVPPALRTAFSDEPRWLDLRWLHDSASPSSDARFAEAVADLSAPIRGVSRDELIGEDLAQHRKVRRLTRAAISGLTLLLITSIVATVIAVRQRDDVLRQAVTLSSRQLASTATGLLGSDLRLAQLMAVHGLRTEDSTVTRSALLAAALASPPVQYFATFEAPVTAIGTGSRAVAVGLADGRVYTVGIHVGDQPTLRFTAPSAVTAIRTTADAGHLLVQADESISVVDASGSRTLGVKAMVGTDAIGLSPSGAVAAVLTSAERNSIVILDPATGKVLQRRRDIMAPRVGEAAVYPQYTQRISFVNDDRLRLVANDARWVTVDLRSGRTSQRGQTDWIPSVQLYQASSRGDRLLSAQIGNGHQVTAWSLDRSGSGKGAVRTAEVQISDPLGLAVSPDGHYLLVSDSASGVSAAAMAAPNDPFAATRFPSSRIPGLDGAGAMEFFSPNRAVIAARNQLAFLTLGGPGRGLTSQRLVPRSASALPGYATDSRSSTLAVAPDGANLAVFESSLGTVELVPVPGHGGRSLAAAEVVSAGTQSLGPLWLDPDTVLVLSSGTGQSSRPLPSGVLVWGLGLEDDPDRFVQALVAQVTPDNRVLIATSDGLIQTREAPSGRLLATAGARVPNDRSYELAAFSADGRYLALLDSESDDLQAYQSATLRVLDPVTGQVLHEVSWPSTGRPDELAFAGSDLLVSHGAGVDIMADAGRGAVTRVATSGNRTSTGSAQRNPPLLGPDGIVGLPTRSGLQLYQLDGLQPLATVPLAAGFETVPRAYAFTPDGSTLISGHFGADRTTARVTFRKLGIEAIVAQTCASAGGAVAVDDWIRLVGGTPPDDLGCR